MESIQDGPIQAVISFLESTEYTDIPDDEQIETILIPALESNLGPKDLPIKQIKKFSKFLREYSKRHLLSILDAHTQGSNPNTQRFLRINELALQYNIYAYQMTSCPHQADTTRRNRTNERHLLSTIADHALYIALLYDKIENNQILSLRYYLMALNYNSQILEIIDHSQQPKESPRFITRDDYNASLDSIKIINYMLNLPPDITHNLLQELLLIGIDRAYRAYALLQSTNYSQYFYSETVRRMIQRIRELQSLDDFEDDIAVLETLLNPQ